MGRPNVRSKLCLGWLPNIRKEIFKYKMKWTWRPLTFFMSLSTIQKQFLMAEQFLAAWGIEEVLQGLPQTKVHVIKVTRKINSIQWAIYLYTILNQTPNYLTNSSVRSVSCFALYIVKSPWFYHSGNSC